MRARTLPLGIDIGSTRIRVVQVERAGDARHVCAVAVRELPGGPAVADSTIDYEYVGALIEDAVSEIGTKERRCICAIGDPDALLRTVKFPNMTRGERERAARFEARRFIDYPADDAMVRVHPVDRTSGLWALGIARNSAIVTRNAALRAAGLRVLAMDHESCALLRALPDFDAILDIGHQRTSMHVVSDGTPLTLQAYNGGADVTRAIERDLSIDAHTAEKRKRILGTASGGERARAALTSDIASLIHQARGSRPLRRVALVGNGARLAGVAEDLESATSVTCEIAVSHALRGRSYPDDVVRSSAPDWTLAAGLALWSGN